MSHDSPSELSESEAYGVIEYSALNNFLRSLGMISVIERTENNNLMTWQSEIEIFFEPEINHGIRVATP